MRRIVLIVSALVFGSCASTIGAQSTGGTTPTDQPGTQSTTDLPPPPPFPPMPRAKPTHRWVSTGGRERTTAHHRSKVTHHGKRSEEHRTGRLEKHRTARVHHKEPALSRKTIRRCHHLSYGQIMRSPDCRSLMKQDLNAAERPHHRGKHHHNTKTSHRRSDHHRRHTKRRR